MRFSLHVAVDGELVIELGEHFSDEDIPALVAAENALHALRTEAA